MPNNKQIRPFFVFLVWATLGALFLFVGVNELPKWTARVEQWWNTPAYARGRFAEGIGVAIQTAIASSPRPDWFTAQGVSILELSDNTILVGVVMAELDYRFENEQLVKNEAKQQSDPIIANVLCRRFHRTEGKFAYEGGEIKLTAEGGSTYWAAQMIQAPAEQLGRIIFHPRLFNPASIGGKPVN